MKNFFCSIFLLIFASSCASRVEKHGYMFDLSDHHLLQEGITTKERAAKIMGSPSFVSALDADETWVYYSEDVKNFLFFIPDVTSRSLLFVRFDKKDMVKEVSRLGLDDEEKNLEFATNYTFVDSHKTGFLKSLFSNVGKVKPQ